MLSFATAKHKLHPAAHAQLLQLSHHLLLPLPLLSRQVLRNMVSRTTQLLGQILLHMRSPPTFLHPTLTHLKRQTLLHHTLTLLRNSLRLYNICNISINMDITILTGTSCSHCGCISTCILHVDLRNNRLLIHFVQYIANSCNWHCSMKVALPTSV